MMSCSKGLEHTSLDALTVVEKSTKSLTYFGILILVPELKINNFEKENSN